MSARALLVLFTVACLSQARPVKKTLNFNMFVLRPRQDAPDRFLLATDGVSRFGPILEYLVQRVQGLMSVRLSNDKPYSYYATKVTDVPVADAAQNEVDSVQETRAPGIIVKPSSTKPGTYEVEINVVVDDGQPEDQTK